MEVSPQEPKNIFNINKKTLILTLIIVSVIAGGIGVYEWKKTHQQESPKIVSGDPEQMVGSIIATKDVTRCSELGNAHWETVCVNNIALVLAEENQDISYCNKLDNILIERNDCVRQIILQKAIKAENSTPCQEAQDNVMRSECENRLYQILASQKSDGALCQKITDQAKASTCRDNYLLEHEFIGNEKSFDCTRLGNQDVKDDCVYAKKAVIDGKSMTSVCNKMKSPQFTALCALTQ